MNFPTPTFLAQAAPADEVGTPKSFLLYGDTGTQKTLTLQKLFKAGYYKKVLFLNIDNGAEVLYADPVMREALKPGGAITQIKFNPRDPAGTVAQLESIVLEITGMYRDPATGAILPHPQIPDFGYDFVFVDTVNLLADVTLKHLKATTYNDQGNKLDGLKAYARLSDWADEMVRLLHDTPRFATGFVMHAKSYKDDATSQSKIKPKMQGSFKDSIATIPSITAYLDYEKDPTDGVVKLTAITGASDEADAKNRYDLPPKIYGFDIVEIYGGIYDSIGQPRPTPVPEPAQQAPAPPVSALPPAPQAPAAPAAEAQSTTPAIAA